MPAQKLLIIDDSVDIHELVNIWLADEQLEFTSRFDGESGLASALELRPDLILLDVDLPGLNGFEVCRRLKAAAPTMDIPVVFLTGASSTLEKLRGLELGATDYVTKPFDPAELRARVCGALNTKRLSDLLAQKALVLQESEERFRVLAENSSDVISRHTADGVYLYASPACRAILSYPPEAMIGHRLVAFVHPEDIDAVVACWSAPRNSGETATVTYRFRRCDGLYVWLESTCRTLSEPTTGVVREIHSSSRDVSVRHEMQSREQIRAHVLEMIAGGNPLIDILRCLIDAAEQQEPEAIAAGVMISNGHLHHCAPNLPSQIGFSIERQMYRLMSRFTTLASQTVERVIVCDLTNDPSWEEMRPQFNEHGLKCCWTALILSRDRHAAGAFTLYRRDCLRPSASTVELMKLASELTSVAVDHRQLSDQLTFQARHDGLTQLPNRAMFNDRLEQTLATSARSGRPGAVLVVDVDRFKHINDTYGHLAGDQLLCEVAARLGRDLRKSDTLARMGGDEFALILADLSNAADAEMVAKSLIEEFAIPTSLNGREIFVSVSLGLAVFPRNGTDPVTLLKNADLAMYRAKETGRNNCRSFTPDMGEGAVERLELETALRHAVPNGELRLYYQPKVDLSQLLVGIEALVRWEHPVLGMIPPARFIPIAEDTGLILPIGAWVLREAVSQICDWVSSGVAVVPVAVNVSALQFMQPEFVGSIAEALRSIGIPQSCLEIELTESLLMGSMSEAVDKLAQLKELNVRVAIDDFGTGYSSLAYLQRLSIDTLKIDQSFVNSMESDRNSHSGKTIVGAIISLAKALGLNVIAEGVETETQRQFLISLGCDQMQGFLFGPPMTADLIEQVLRARQQEAMRNRVAA
jgi:diguanylate cyclase (GGDEF)-like protein/PAS domain S-box-containing protein